MYLCNNENEFFKYKINIYFIHQIMHEASVLGRRYKQKYLLYNKSLRSKTPYYISQEISFCFYHKSCYKYQTTEINKRKIIIKY